MTKRVQSQKFDDVLKRKNSFTKWTQNQKFSDQKLPKSILKNCKNIYKVKYYSIHETGSSITKWEGSFRDDYSPLP